MDNVAGFQLSCIALSVRLAAGAEGVPGTSAISNAAMFDTPASLPLRLIAFTAKIAFLPISSY